MINPVSYATSLPPANSFPVSGPVALPASTPPVGDTVNFSAKALADAVVSAQLAGAFSPQ
jgi:hypothetical protein